MLLGSDNISRPRGLFPRLEHRLVTVCYLFTDVVWTLIRCLTTYRMIPTMATVICLPNKLMNTHRDWL